LSALLGGDTVAGMGHQWREDEKQNRLHCFETKLAGGTERVGPGDLALCGWVFEGAAASGMIVVAEWRAVQGNRSICHDCNLRWERAARVSQPS